MKAGSELLCAALEADTLPLTQRNVYSTDTVRPCGKKEQVVYHFWWNSFICGSFTGSNVMNRHVCQLQLYVFAVDVVICLLFVNHVWTDWPQMTVICDMCRVVNPMWTGWPQITVLCDMCRVVNPMWTDWPQITVMCDVCRVVNPMWTDWPQITVMCDMCCIVNPIWTD